MIKGITYIKENISMIKRESYIKENISMIKRESYIKHINDITYNNNDKKEILYNL